MYEVFLNDRKIIIAGENEQPLMHKEAIQFFNPGEKSLVRQVMSFLADEYGDIIFMGEIEFIWSRFRQMFKELPAAGGVVQRNGRFLFIFRRGKWDLPKGKIDTGESPEEAALREVTEETGLKAISIEDVLPSTWHIYQSCYKGTEGVWILKETKWFSMQAYGNEQPVPETGEDIEEVRWFARNEINEVGASTYSSLKGLIGSLE